MLALPDHDGRGGTEPGNARNCHFKLGCCEGDPQTACDAPTSVVAWQAPSSKRAT